ncbi:MAG: hypothetical protein KDD35_09905, partial [Bdellovibrionales bacterium]|nr:hypothetical protein [Bdellovibrionales bacterium]
MKFQIDGGSNYSSVNFLKESFVAARVVITSSESYTHRYAKRFGMSWKHQFNEELVTIDWFSSLSLDSPRIHIESWQSNSFTLEGKSYECVYAFHPRHKQFKFKEPYLEEALLSAYACGLIAAGCPNPPPFGRWGLHITALEGLRILDDCGLPRIEID